MVSSAKARLSAVASRCAPALILCTAAGLASCGGGGGSSPNLQPTATPKPSATPTASAVPSATPLASATPVHTATPAPTGVPSVATVTGTVVDFDSNQGLGGIAVSIAKYADSAGSYNVVATSAADGTFSFSTTPGNYVVAVGTNAASDTTRATEHDYFAFAPGPNPIGGPIEAPVADVTPVPSQTSGHFRLATITSTEQGCVNAVNAGRANHNVPALSVDEESLELSRALLAEELAQETDQPSPLSGSTTQGTYQATGETRYASGLDYATCSSFTDTYTFQSSSIAYGTAISPATTWFGAGFGAAGGHKYVNEIFGSDPKNDAP